MPIPFESQFFHDDGDVDDEGYVDDNLDSSATFDGSVLAPGEEADDLLAGTQGTELKKSKPENVHFAKRAKRIDVKRLKDDIWSGLKSLVPEPSSDPDESVSYPSAVTVYTRLIQFLSRTTLNRPPLPANLKRPKNPKPSTASSPPSEPPTRVRRCPSSQPRSALYAFYTSPTKRDSGSRQRDSMAKTVRMWVVWAWPKSAESTRKREEQNGGDWTKARGWTGLWGSCRR